MSRLFDDFFGYTNYPGALFSFSSTGNIVPKMDMSENKKEYSISLDLPGIEEKDIDLTIENDRLTIKAERKSEQKNEDENYYFAEKTYGSVFRAITLPSNADSEKVSANFKNGVLEIRITKKENGNSNVKKIAVNK